MVLNIRAGILFNLAADSFDKITKGTVLDILYTHKKLHLVTELSYYLFLLDSYPDSCGESDEYYYITKLFPKFATYILELFLGKGYSVDNVAWMAEQLLYVIPELREDQIVINNWRSGPTYGKTQEKVALAALAEAGFIIAPCESRSIDIDNGGTAIRLHGRPDGVIISSPGGCYKSGTLVEIKSKRYDNRSTSRDLSQICAYSVIFDCDVLYVKIYENSIKCELLKAKHLQSRFRDRFNYVSANCKRLSDIIEKSDTDDAALIELVDLCKRTSKKNNQ
jgi:hypothetical protein